MNIYSFAGLRNSRKSRTDDLMSADERPVIRQLPTRHPPTDKPLPADRGRKRQFFQRPAAAKQVIKTAGNNR